VLDGLLVDASIAATGKDKYTLPRAPKVFNEKKHFFEKLRRLWLGHTGNCSHKALALSRIERGAKG
jgi:hypothetical protein